MDSNCTLKNLFGTDLLGGSQLFCSMEVTYSVVGGAAAIVLLLVVTLVMCVALCCLAGRLKAKKARSVCQHQIMCACVHQNHAYPWIGQG